MIVRLLISVLSLLPLLAALGCRTLPNVTPFTDATSKLYVAVQMSGDSAVAEVAAVEKAIAEAQSRQPDNKQAESIRSGWGHAVLAAQAVNDYSASLQALVESGEKGKEAAQAAISSVGGLLNKLGAAYPAGTVGAEAVTATFEGLTKLYAVAAKQAAAKALEKAIEEADPTIQATASLLSKYFAALSPLLQDAERDLLFKMLSRYTTQRAYLNQYQSLRTNLLDKVVVTNRLTTDTKLLAELESVEKLIESEHRQQWYLDYITERAALEARFEGELAVVEKAQAVIQAWAVSHRELVGAVRDRRNPTFAVLIPLSTDLLETFENAKGRVDQIKAEARKKRLEVETK